MRHMLVILMAVLLVGAAACSSDSDGDSTEASESTETPTAEDDAEATAEPTEEPTDDATTEPTEEATTDEPPADLPASFRGVTEDTIKVGVADPDWDALRAAGIPNYQGETQIAFQPFFDLINEAGGIYGRQIEPVYAEFDFTSPVTQEEACTKLTEDEEVFIVLYGLLAQNNLCFTDLHDTMVMTRFFQTPELREQSGDTLWLQLNTADEFDVAVNVIAETGRLDGKNVAILTSASTTAQDVGEELAQTLIDLGYPTQHVHTANFGDDAIARDDELALVAERFMVDGVDYVFDLTGGANVPEVMANAGYTPEWFVSAIESALTGTTDKSTMDGAVTVGPINELAVFDDPEFRENCMQVVLDAHPELEPEFEYLPTGDQQAAGEPDWMNPIIHACNYTMLLKELGEIAGADLTNDSFRAALDELGPIYLHGLGQASFNSESKWDGLDEFYIQVYNAETDEIEIQGDAVIVDRG